MFYHDLKAHMSPSALAQWLNSRGAFVRSYFAEERGPETAAMTAGTEIHALVEAGIIPAKHVYQHGEAELKVEVPGTSFYFLGRPDSYERHWSGKKEGEGEPADTAYFVDYKSGKANGWDEKLPADIKMRATAWLVWRATGEPDKVCGFVEFIQTTWDPDQKKVVPMEGRDTEVTSIVYTADELRAFTKVIAKAMEDVNAFYEKWKESTGDFVSNGDVTRYAELKAEIATRETELDEVAERILGQMDFGGEENHKTPVGTFFVKTTKTYEYPAEMPFLLDGEEPYTLAKAERVASGVSAAKANYNLTNEPSSIKRSVQFRAAKK